jgi:Protein of unknown function (DUF1838)
MTSKFVDDLLLNRESALAAVAGMARDPGPAPQAAAMAAGSRTRDRALNWDDPRDNLYAFGKIWAGYAEPQIGAYHGLMYARIGTRRLIPLFGYTGTGVMQSRIDTDGNVWLRGKETGYFTDLATGDILETWDNPFTGEKVPVFHFYNGTMGGKLTAEMPRFAMGASREDATLMNEGTHREVAGTVPFLLPFQIFGDDLMLAWDYAHEYPNPVTPEKWRKASTGPRINPSEHFTFSMSLAQMQDRSEPSCRFTAGFARLSPWWPWMRMGGSPYQNDVLFGRMFSHKGLKGYGDVPPKVLAYIEKHAPAYLEPPEDWPQQQPRDTWSAYASQVPPETNHVKDVSAQ